MIYIKLFISFFKIGLFGFGGGYAMLSLIHNEVVTINQWISNSMLTDIVAISQMTPGPIVVNCATYVGYTVTGSIWGAIVATLAVATPSAIIMSIIAFFFNSFKNNKHVSAVISVIKPMVIAMIIIAAVSMITKENFPDYKSIIIFVVAAIATLSKKVSPILVIILAGVAGYYLY